MLTIFFLKSNRRYIYLYLFVFFVLLQLHSIRRNKLAHACLDDLVFVKYNGMLRHQYCVIKLIQSTWMTLMKVISNWLWGWIEMLMTMSILCLMMILSCGKRLQGHLELKRVAILLGHHLWENNQRELLQVPWFSRFINEEEEEEEDTKEYKSDVKVPFDDFNVDDE